MSDESFKAGQKIACTVVAPSQGGLVVTVVIGGKQKRGFLQTKELIPINESVIATFVSWSNGLALLIGPTTRETVTTAVGSRIPLMRCMEHLRSGYRRASDIMPIPVNGELSRSIQLEQTFDVFCDEISRDRHTGVIKLDSSEHKTRLALLFHRGRIVGCVRNSIHTATPLDTQTVSTGVFASFRDSKASLQVYDLPSSIVVPMAALFCGHQYLLPEGLNSVGAILAVSSSVAETNAVCVAISMVHTLAFAYFYKQQFSGFYCVELQTFNNDFGDLLEALSDSSTSIVGCYILPNEFNSKNKDGLAFTFNECDL